MVLRKSLFGILSLSVLLSGAVRADMLDVDLTSEKKIGELGQGLAQSARLAAEGKSQAAALGAVESTIDFLLPGIGADAPDWARRIEFEWQLRENNAPEYSILTVQPLWESENVQDTVFTQLSYRRYEMFSQDRNVANMGLGYRRLLFDNTVLVGANGFFDYEFNNHHQRPSLGVEAKWAGLDFSANRYWGTSSAHSTDRNAGTEEEPLDGHDIQLTAQVPYLPWARVSGRRYWWQTKTASEDIKGWEAGVEMDLFQNIQLEAGVNSDNFLTDPDENEVYLMSRFHFNFNRPVAASSQVVSSKPWLMRDMTDYRLDKVKRENKIIVERRSSGVVITRGS